MRHAADTCTVTTEEAPAIDLVRQTLYRFLALALTDPEAERWEALLDPRLLDAAIEAAELLREADGTSAMELAPGELPLARLNLNPIVAQLRHPYFDPELEYRRTFGLLVSKKAPPYETEYCRQTLVVYRQQVLADVAGFYRAFGLEPSRELPERHDHLALELEFMAWLIAKEQRARRAGNLEQGEVCRDAQRSFLRDHLVWWVPAFATLLRLGCEDRGGRAHDADPRTFYGAVATSICAFLHGERVRFQLPAPTELVEPRAADTELTR
jgi:TorA maturation chaperone TorD